LVRLLLRRSVDALLKNALMNLLCNPCRQLRMRSAHFTQSLLGERRAMLQPRRAFSAAIVLPHEGTLYRANS